MSTEVEDHVLHGLARIRLVAPPPAASRRIARVLGTTPVASQGTADITITYVDSCATGTALRWIGRHRSAFDEDTFYAVERSRNGRVGLSTIPFEQLGRGEIDICCDRSVSSPPGLLDILNVVILAKGILPLHGSAFRWGGAGVVAAGWSKGGKTETLLAFAQDGADVIADEWAYVTPDRRMFGIAGPIRLESAHLAYLGPGRSVVGRGTRARAAAARTAIGAHRALFERRRLPGAGLARALVPLAEARDSVTVSPRDLFDGHYVGASDFDRVALLVTAAVPSPEVHPTTPASVAARMTHAHVHHRRDLLARYHEYRYGFPDRVCDVLERIEQVEHDLLERVLQDVPCIEVRLPQPPAIAELYRVLAPVFSRQPRAQVDGGPNVDVPFV